MSRWWLIFGFAIVALLLWTYRVELTVRGVAFHAEWNRVIEPSRSIVWQRGTDAPINQHAGRPPNIVLILADDLGWNDVSTNGGGAGGGSVKTPNIDGLAKAGVNFPSGYAASGTCAPSRAAILSGRYGTRFGFEFTPVPTTMGPMLALLGSAGDKPRRLPIRNPHFEQVDREDMGMPASEITLAETLKSRSYHNVHIGKWHLGQSEGMTPNEQGFDESLRMQGTLYLPEDHPNVVNSKQTFDPIDRFLWARGGYGVSYNDGPAFQPTGHLTDYFTDQAVRVIEANRNRPFFLYLAHMAVHTPLQDTREDYEAYVHIDNHTERTYAAMIRGLDRSVGRVLEALRQQELQDDTLVIFTSDNGGAAYLGLPHLNRPFRGWKMSFFEGGIRVPYIMRWPARLASGQSYRAPVHHFDLYATAAAAAGAPLPDDRVIDGVDLLSYLRRETAGVPHETLFWTQDHYRVVLHRGWKLQRNGPDDEFLWLFDLSEDPTEQINLAGVRPDKVSELDELLEAHLAGLAPPRWPHRASMPIGIDKSLNQIEADADEFIYYPN